LTCAATPTVRNANAATNNAPQPPAAGAYRTRAHRQNGAGPAAAHSTNLIR
jgi:hypothetical protein